MRYAEAEMQDGCAYHHACELRHLCVQVQHRGHAEMRDEKENVRYQMYPSVPSVLAFAFLGKVIHIGHPFLLSMNEHIGRAGRWPTIKQY
jgi:hypothetical protein